MSQDIRDKRDQFYLEIFKLVQKSLPNWSGRTGRERLYVADMVDEAIKRLEGRSVER